MSLERGWSLVMEVSEMVETRKMPEITYSSFNCREAAHSECT